MGEVIRFQRPGPGLNLSKWETAWDIADYLLCTLQSLRAHKKHIRSLEKLLEVECEKNSILTEMNTCLKTQLDMAKGVPWHVPPVDYYEIERNKKYKATFDLESRF